MSLQVDAKLFLRRDVPLKTFSTFKIGGRGSWVAEPTTLDELRAVLDFGSREGMAMTIIGRGSNILFDDDGYKGIVLCLRRFGSQALEMHGNGAVRASAGVSLARLSEFALGAGLSGLEFCCHIPGAVGGAIVMNAGFGRRGSSWREMKDVVTSVTALNMASGSMVTLRSEEIGFQYRKTGLNKDLIIVEAVFGLEPGSREAINREIEANFAYRNGVQDLSYPSAGSVFRNPSGCELKSGQLLDRVGMKGMRIGDAMVSEKHANFFLNVGQAKAKDVLDLIEIARKRVMDQFGVALELELKYVSSES